MSDPKRVLIVDDDDNSRITLARMLRVKRFHVREYAACAPAEQHLTSCDIDIALLDARLPGRTGDDFGKELRERCPGAMIVFLTAEPLLEPLKEAVPDCFVLRRPVDPAVLLQLLEGFGSSAGYSSPMQNWIDDRAGPAKMS